MQPWNMLGIAEEEITARLQVTRHLAKEHILRLLIEVNESIAKEDNVEEVIERPAGIHQIDAFELDKPGNLATSGLTFTWPFMSSLPRRKYFRCKGTSTDAGESSG